jgi:hypothetical protein
MLLAPGFVGLGDPGEMDESFDRHITCASLIRLSRPFNLSNDLVECIRTLWLSVCGFTHGERAVVTTPVRPWLRRASRAAAPARTAACPAA